LGFDKGWKFLEGEVARVPATTPKDFQKAMQLRKDRAERKGVPLFTNGKDHPFIIAKYDKAREGIGVRSVVRIHVEVQGALVQRMFPTYQVLDHRPQIKHSYASHLKVSGWLAREWSDKVRLAVPGEMQFVGFGLSAGVASHRFSVFWRRQSDIPQDSGHVTGHPARSMPLPSAPGHAHLPHLIPCRA